MWLKESLVLSKKLLRIMNNKILDTLCCPYHTNYSLILKTAKICGNEVNEGELVCDYCKRVFPIKDTIPYLLPDNLLEQRLSGKSIDNWQPGPRKWSPDFVSLLISGFKYRDAQEKETIDYGLSNLNIGCGESIKNGVNVDIYIPQNTPSNFVLASAEHLPFKDNSFDTVESSYVIEHLVNPSDFIKRQYAIARGKVIITTDNSEWVGDLWFRLMGHGRIFHDEHYYRWNVDYLNNLITRLGFKGRVFTCNLSRSFLVKMISGLGGVPRIGVWFNRDLIAEIAKNE